MIVLIAVAEKQVVITDQLSTTPITGRQAIFARVQAPTETKLDVEIVGVYSDLELAATARAAHAKRRPGYRYVQKVAALDDGTGPDEEVEAACIMCGTPTGGPSYCPPCRQEHWARQRAADPDLPAEAAPPVPATAGQDTRYLVTQ